MTNSYVRASLKVFGMILKSEYLDSAVAKKNSKFEHAQQTVKLKVKLRTFFELKFHTFLSCLDLARKISFPLFRFGLAFA